jgi:outer membrane receptor for monomeric catechols
MASRSATATKTDTPIKDTPAAIQVIPRQVIEDQRAQSLKDVYDNASSVQMAGNTLNAQAEVLPIIRGFESPTLLRNGLRSSVVGSVDLANIERVEVLKGRPRSCMARCSRAASSTTSPSGRRRWRATRSTRKSAATAISAPRSIPPGR